MQHARKGTQQGGLTQPRHALQQNVSSRQQADENAIHHFLLAHDHFSDFLAHPIQLLGGELKRCVRLHALYDSAASLKRLLCQMGNQGGAYNLTARPLISSDCPATLPNGMVKLEYSDA